MSKPNLKIVIVGPAFPYRGGNSLFVSHLYFTLIEKFDVTLLNYKLLYPNILFPGTTQYDKSTEVIKKAPNQRTVSSINPISWIKTANIIKNENPALVVFDWWHPFFSFCHYSISSLLGSKFKNKILFITENIISHEGRFIERILTRIGLHNASSFLCLSKNVADELKTIAKERIIYRSELPVYDCYNSSDSSVDYRSKLGLAEDDKVLLFFGYVRKYKGLDILLNALKLLVGKDKLYKLLIAGEFYDDQEFYLDLIKKLDLTGFIKFENKFISNEDVHNYYAPADIVILPYRSGTQSGILNVAYGFNKPVIVTDVGGLAEFVEEKKTGFVVKPESPEQIATAVVEYFNLKSTIDFGANISAYQNSNSFGKIAGIFENIIKDIK